MSANLSVCYFGAYRSNYPRNLTIRRALALATITVVECQVPPKWKSWRRWLSLTYQFLCNSKARAATVIIVAEFCHTLVPLAWVLSRLTGAALLFDPGISFYEEMIVSQQAAPPESFRARYLRGVDSRAFRLADFVIWFTPVDEEYFGRLYRIPTERAAWLPPGVDSESFAFSPPPEIDSPFVVHWDGSFIASHGVEVILDAANLLRNYLDIHFELVGDGPVSDEMRQRAESLKLANVIFRGTVSFEELVESVKRSHICLGTFRADDKQRRSLYTKELQAMMAGRALITAEGEAKRRVFKPDEELVLIPPQDASDLADAILKLKADAPRRHHLGEHGHAAVSALCSPESIQYKLMTILHRAREQRRR
ncbi:MAG: glycosyltransferase [Chloroflexi bacterium]|nr:glycosyltransferase [Chloroflexota bacterium]